MEIALLQVVNGIPVMAGARARASNGWNLNVGIVVQCI